VPRAERPLPPYVQIANYYRTAILNGDLAPGQQLPSISAIAAEWDVSASTAAKAISHLQVEGAIWTSPQGSFVSDEDVIDKTPQDRIRATAPRRSTTNGGHVEVTAAEIVTAPNYVAELLGVPIGTQVVRREEITYRKSRPRMLSVDWITVGSDPMLAAEAVAKHELAEGGAVRLIERETGRRVTHGRDHLRGRASDAREAGALRLPIGSPILAGTNVWSDNDGVLLYGEWVMPADQVVSYEYAVEAGASTEDTQ
jgi:GntR family transcriptional regulator